MPSGRVTAGAARADVRMRVEPANGVGDRVARDLDVGIQHELIVGAGAVQHQVVRDAVADVARARAGRCTWMPESAKRALPSRITSSATLRSSLLSISATATLRTHAVLARGADRERELAQAALEQHRVRPERDDADGQRGGKHEDGLRESAAGTARQSRTVAARRVESSKNRAAASTAARRFPFRSATPAMSRTRTLRYRRRRARRIRHARCCERAGVRADIARDVADVLVDRRSPRPHDARARAARALSRRDREGRDDESRRADVVNARPAAQTWDGERLPGPWLTLRALDAAAAMAATHGTGTVVIRRSHHIACLAAYLLRATERGLVAIVESSDPIVAAVVPHGGLTPIITPNPIAAGLPTSGDPILVDVSSSITSMGFAKQEMRAGRKLPGPWLIDAEGNATDDPARAVPRAQRRAAAARRPRRRLQGLRARAPRRGADGGTRGSRPRRSARRLGRHRVRAGARSGGVRRTRSVPAADGSHGARRARRRRRGRASIACGFPARRACSGCASSRRTASRSIRRSCRRSRRGRTKLGVAAPAQRTSLTQVMGTAGVRTRQWRSPWPTLPYRRRRRSPTRRVHDARRHPRLARELATLTAMIRIHCHDLHGEDDGLCDDCARPPRRTRRGGSTAACSATTSRPARTARSTATARRCASDVA